MPHDSLLSNPLTPSHPLCSLSFVNLTALAFGSPQCYVRYDYVDQLMVQTLAPICVVQLLIICFALHLVAIRSKGSDVRSEVITRYLNLFFLITYLVLPSTTTTIFGAFTCRSIDPDNVMPGTPHYLRNDLSISCSSSRYYLAVHWAIVMIFVYPVGITCMYAYVLYVNREDIMNEGEIIAEVDELPSATADSGDDAHSAPCSLSTRTGSVRVSTRGRLMKRITLKEIQFLHKAYEGRCWYWEVVETSRRLLLTAVLSVVTVGKSNFIGYSVKCPILPAIFISVRVIKSLLQWSTSFSHRITSD
jgi:hypothetical protein